LLDSAFRLSLMLSVLCYFLLNYRFGSFLRQIYFSFFLSFFHISGLVYFFLNKFTLRFFFLPVVFLAFVFISDVFSDRLGVKYSYALVGLKFYLASLFVSFLYFIFGFKDLVFRFIFVQTALLLFASFIFPMANRWMAFVLLISIIKFSYVSRNSLPSDFKLRFSFFVLFILLSLPNVYFSFGVSV